MTSPSTTTSRGKPFRTKRVTLKAGLHKLAAGASNIGMTGPYSWAMLTWKTPARKRSHRCPASYCCTIIPDRLDKAGRRPQRPAAPAAQFAGRDEPQCAPGKPPTRSPTAVAPATKPAPPRPVSSARHPVQRGSIPVPDEAQTAEARKRVRERFASYYAERKPMVQQALVQKLTEAAGVEGTPPLERYALLKEAADVAAANGDWRGALAAVRQISGLFTADEVEPSLAVLAAAARSPGRAGARGRAGDRRGGAGSRRDRGVIRQLRGRGPGRDPGRADRASRRRPVRRAGEGEGRAAPRGPVRVHAARSDARPAQSPTPPTATPTPGPASSSP